MATVILYFDGACEPNPGLGSWGFVIFDEHGAEFDRGSGLVSGQATNNVAEYHALGHGLKAALSLAGPKTELIVRGDSKLVVEQMKGSWACNSDRLLPLLRRCRELSDQIKDVEFEWIPREQNMVADSLSVYAWCQHTGKPFPERRKAKA